MLESRVSSWLVHRCYGVKGGPLIKSATIYLINLGVTAPAKPWLYRICGRWSGLLN